MVATAEHQAPLSLMEQVSHHILMGHDIQPALPTPLGGHKRKVGHMGRVQAGVALDLHTGWGGEGGTRAPGVCELPQMHVVCPANRRGMCARGRYTDREVHP